MDKELEGYLNTTYDTLKKADKSDAEIEAATRELYEKYTASKAATKTIVENKYEQMPGMPKLDAKGQQAKDAYNAFSGMEKQNLDDSMVVDGGKWLTKQLWQATGLADVAASATRTAQLGVDLAKQAVGLPSMTAQESTDLLAKPVDFGWLGEKEALKNPLDAMGAGAKIYASFLTPIGAEGALATAAATKAVPWIAKSPFWANSAGKFLAETAPMAGGFATGETVQSLGKGKDVGESLSDGAWSYIQNLAGFGLLKGGGQILKYLAEPLVKSEFTKYLSGKFAALADDTFNTFKSASEKAKSDMTRIESTVEVLARDIPTELEAKAAQQAFNDLKKQAVADVTANMKAPDVEEQMWYSVSTAVKNKTREIYDAISNQYKDVYTPNIKIEPVSPAKGMIMSSISKNTEKFIEPRMKVMAKTPEDAVKFASGNVGELANEIMNLFKKGEFSLKTVDDLWRKYGGVLPDKVENQAIRNILSDVTSAARSRLANSTIPEEKALVPLWEKASLAHKNVSAQVDSNFYDILTTTGNPKAFVDKIFNKKPTAEFDSILRTLDGMKTDPDMKNAMSQMIYNSILERAMSYSDDAVKNGKALTSFIDNWANTDLMNPTDMQQLRALGEMMQSTYDDFAQAVTRYGGIESVAPAKQAASDLMTLEARKTTAEAYQKALDKGLFKELKDGSINAKEALKTLEKANTDGQYDDLIKQLPEIEKATKEFVQVQKAYDNGLIKTLDDGKFDASGLGKLLDTLNTEGQYDDVIKQIAKSGQLQTSDLTNIIKGVMEMGGGGIAFGSHPFIAFSLLSTGVRGISKEFSKKGAMITSEQMDMVVKELLAKGDLQGFNKLIVSKIADKNPYIANQFAKLLGININEVFNSEENRI